MRGWPPRAMFGDANQTKIQLDIAGAARV